jgi:hypothetical protein
MRGATSRLRRLLAAGLLLFGALSTIGCVPGVAWLPDSSGFIYTSGEQFTTLAHYDVTSHQSKVLVENTGAPTLWPALSPDGKRIAVGRVILVKGQKQSKLQVILYDRSGKELKRSQEFDWLQGDQPAQSEKLNDMAVAPQLFWAPRGERIVIQSIGKEPYAAIYDIQADRLLHSGPAVLLTFGSTPIRPDGAGFLLMKNPRWANWWDKKPGEVDPDPQFTFVDWEGKEKTLKPPAYLLDGEALKKETDPLKLYALLLPAFFESRWRGEVAEVSYGPDRLRYDIAKGEAVLDKVKPETTREGHVILRQYPIALGRATLRVVGPEQKEGERKNIDFARLEVVKAGQQKAQVLIPELNWLPVLVPAPNGKHVAIWSQVKENKREKGALLLVVNEQGEATGRIELGLKP